MFALLLGIITIFNGVVPCYAAEGYDNIDESIYESIYDRVYGINNSLAYITTDAKPKSANISTSYSDSNIVYVPLNSLEFTPFYEIFINNEENLTLVGYYDQKNKLMYATSISSLNWYYWDTDDGRAEKKYYKHFAKMFGDIGETVVINDKGYELAYVFKVDGGIECYDAKTPYTLPTVSLNSTPIKKSYVRQEDNKIYYYDTNKAITKKPLRKLLKGVISDKWL